MPRAIEFILADLGRACDDPVAAEIISRSSSEIIRLRNRLAAAFRRNRKLDALESMGVDNWEGYDEAMRDLYDEDSSLGDD